MSEANKKGSLCVRKLDDGGRGPEPREFPPLRRPKRSAEKFEIGGSNQGATRKIAGGERLRGRASRDDLGLLKVDLEPDKPKATDQGRKEVPKSRSRTCAKPIIEEERTDVDATQKQGLRGSMGLSNDRLDGKSEEDRAQRVSLLSSPGTGNNLRSRHTRASEEDTAVDPWNERRKVNTSSPQHHRSVNCVEGVGDVDRNCNLVHIRTVTVKPLTGRMTDRLAPVRCLDPKLKRLQKNTSALRGR